MTLKQKMFVKQYLKNGGNGTQAVLDTYNVKNYNTAHSIASENLQKPAIKQAIEETFEATGLTDAYISETLKKATESGLGKKSTNADSLRGLDMMFKIKGLYPDRVHKSAHLSINYKQRAEEMSSKELKVELARIQELTARILSEDYTPTPAKSK